MMVVSVNAGASGIGKGGILGMRKLPLSCH